MNRRVWAIVGGLILLGAIVAALLLSGIGDSAGPAATAFPSATPTLMPEIFSTDRL